jgi:hypothetical protein
MFRERNIEIIARRGICVVRGEQHHEKMLVVG